MPWYPKSYKLVQSRPKGTKSQKKGHPKSDAKRSTEQKSEKYAKRLPKIFPNRDTNH